MKRLCPRWLLVVFLLGVTALVGFAAPVEPGSTPEWKTGVWADPNFFPIAIWLQSPANAEKYKAAGINTYVALWRGPTAAQLDALKQAGLKVVCHQNEIGMRPEYKSTVIAWMHGDEPDNAQSLGSGQGYGPPILPEKIVKDYQELRAKDPTRPVLLNLGQGVAWDEWHGRGVRSRHPEDYPKYIEGCDVVSFDIYPAVHDRPQVAGNLWYVARGVERLVNWSQGRKGVWNCLECTHISNPDAKATPDQVRAEAWMSLIHGSQGLIYFVHQFKPTFREAALLDDPEMLAGVTKLNREILELAPVINGPALTGELAVKSASEDVPVAATARRHNGATYVFAVCMRNGKTKASFTLKAVKGGKVTVLGESRNLAVSEGSFEDEFGPWGVHLYKL